MNKADKIRQMVRDRVADALLAEANGESESLLKEVFEHCNTRSQIEIANLEARRLAKLIRSE